VDTGGNHDLCGVTNSFHSHACHICLRTDDYAKKLCVCCSAFSVQQPRARAKDVASIDPQSSYGHLRCNLCEKHTCYSCCSELHTLFTQFVKKHSTLQEDKDAILANPWFIHAEKLLLDPTSLNNSTICVGHCCLITSTIGKSPHPGVNIIIPNTASHRLPKEIVPQGSYSGSDTEYLPDKVLQNKLHHRLKVKNN